MMVRRIVFFPPRLLVLTLTAEYGDHKRLSSRDLASSQVDRDPYVADPENINLVEGHHPDLYGAHAPLDDDDDLDRLFLGSQAGRHESRARSGSALGGYGDGTGLQDGYGLDDFAGFDVGDVSFRASFMSLSPRYRYLTIFV